MRPAWFPDWSGRAVAVIACGPSASRSDCDSLKGRVRAIAVNRAHELAPWADALYVCDARFWSAYPEALRFVGLKLCQDEEFCRAHPDVRHVRLKDGNEISLVEPGVIAGGGHGGFQAFNLAVQAGANPILLVGFDLSGDRGLHFHRPHPRPLTNPHNPYSFDQWRNAFNNSEAMLRRLAIEVINCAPASALNVFPKMTVAEALLKCADMRPV